MYLTDPSLYGATLPQKEFSIPTPFMNPFFGATQPMQGIPWQGFQGQSLPWQWQNVQPWQNVQRYVPPFFAQGVLPHYGQGVLPHYGQGVLPHYGQGVLPHYGQGALPPYAQSFGYTTPYTTPYMPQLGPMAFNPFIQAGFHNMPLTAWQRYCY